MASCTVCPKGSSLEHSTRAPFSAAGRSYAPDAPNSRLLFDLVLLFLFPVDHGNPSDSQSVWEPCSFFYEECQAGLTFLSHLLVHFKGCWLRSLKTNFTQLVS